MVDTFPFRQNISTKMINITLERCQVVQLEVLTDILVSVTTQI